MLDRSYTSLGGRERRDGFDRSELTMLNKIDSFVFAQCPDQDICLERANNDFRIASETRLDSWIYVKTILMYDYCSVELCDI